MSFLAKCPNRIEVTGFTSGNGLYTSELGSGQPQEFYRQDGGNNCIWRSTTRNHWWINSCSFFGINGGIAYLASDYQCPTDGKKGEWRHGGTEAVLSGYAKIYHG